MTATRPFWLTAFLDLPADSFEAGLTFWEAVTGFPRSARRGDHNEFVSLTPWVGDEYLKLQRTDEPAPRLHLDVHVTDPAAAAQRAVDLGAEQLADPALGYRVLRSPAGLTFCLVSHRCAEVPPPVSWPHGQASRVDQVALDLPADIHDAEAAFWSALLDAPVTALDGAEFSAIDRRPELPMRVLLHRLGEQGGQARAHLDLATDDRYSEVTRHLDLGADQVAEQPSWTVLEDPAGLPYCITEREPA